MKYETISGKIIDTKRNNCTLRDLRMGDRFKTKSSKHRFVVIGEACKWSGGGQSLRSVKNLTTGLIEHKRCNTNVTKC
jgi:hypothetical protein